MARKGVKVKELAAELGVTSRAIIDRCRQAGHAVQNSITRLRPEVERQVRAWFSGDCELPASPHPTTAGLRHGGSATRRVFDTAGELLANCELEEPRPSESS